MNRFGSIAAAATLAVSLSTAEQAQAQAAEILLPHPDGPIAVDVHRVASDTQELILAQLEACLEDGVVYADMDENGLIEGDEIYDFRDEGAYCTEMAEGELRIAQAEARIATAGQLEDAAGTRIEAANARIADLTNGLMEGVRAEGG